MSITISNLLTQSPDVCGGRLRVAGTRMTVQQIAALYKAGLSPEDVADQYPHLSLAQIYAAIAYYHANREEVEATLAAEQVESERLERQYVDLRKSA